MRRRLRQPLWIVPLAIAGVISYLLDPLVDLDQRAATLVRTTYQEEKAVLDFADAAAQGFTPHEMKTDRNAEKPPALGRAGYRGRRECAIRGSHPQART